MKWTKPQRDMAKAKGLGLFAAGYDSKPSADTAAGAGEMTCIMPEDRAHALFWFCMLVYQGKSPADAFAEIHWPSTEA